MRENIVEDKTARHLERLSEALDSGVKSRVRSLINSLSGAEIGDLLESLPLAKRLVVWDLVDTELDGEVLVQVNDEVRAGLRLDLKLSQSELGDLIGATRESVNKQLGTWASEGLLSFDAGHLVIHRLDELEDLAEP